MGLWDWLVGDGSRVPDDYREAGWHRAATPADPNRRKDILRYPNESDVEFAKKYDAFYGTPTDAYVNGTATIHGVTPGDYVNDFKTASRNSNPFNFPAAVAPEIRDQIAAAHLAANRSPLMALGFDPRVATWETDPTQNFNVQGFTSTDYRGPNLPAHKELRSRMEEPEKTPPGQPKPKPKTIKEYIALREKSDNDRMYVDADARHRDGTISSVLGHESIHRGIAKLDKEAPVNIGHTDNEYAVRREMYRKFANPEALYLDDPSFKVNPQITGANDYSYARERYDRMLADLEARAQERIKRARPMGPR